MKVVWAVLKWILKTFNFSVGDQKSGADLGFFKGGCAGMFGLSAKSEHSEQVCQRRTHLDMALEALGS